MSYDEMGNSPVNDTFYQNDPTKRDTQPKNPSIERMWLIVAIVTYAFDLILSVFSMYSVFRSLLSSEDPLYILRNIIEVNPTYIITMSLCFVCLIGFIVALTTRRYLFVSVMLIINVVVSIMMSARTLYLYATIGGVEGYIIMYYGFSFLLSIAYAFILWRMLFKRTGLAFVALSLPIYIVVACFLEYVILSRFFSVQAQPPSILSYLLANIPLFALVVAKHGYDFGRKGTSLGDYS